MTKVLESELWHHRLGHPGPKQLTLLADHATGIPKFRHADPHPFRHCNICADAQHRRSNRGPTIDTSTLRPGSRFHADFGFIRASSDTYRKNKHASRIVTSFDGFNAYLLITDACTRYTFLFLTPSKAPPIDIFRTFLDKYKLTSGTRCIRMDQGGELWRCDDIRQVITNAQYIAEPTGSDSGSQNGKVERPNGTFGVMTRAQLYSAGLKPAFWSAALTHSVYLKNRLYHMAIKMTPFEAWTKQKPDLTHLHAFGALVTVRNPGKPAAKLDRHTSRGIFLGYGATDKHIRYWDLDTHRVKLSNHHVFDECHFSSTSRPPGPQMLFQLGLNPSLHHPKHVQPTTIPPAPYPKIITKPFSFKTTTALPPLPLPKFTPAPTAVAAKLQALPDFTTDDIFSIEFSTDSFGPSFQQPIHINGDHITAGLIFHYDKLKHRLQLCDIQQGTPAYRTPRWRSRLRHAFLLQLHTFPIHTLHDFQHHIQLLRHQNIFHVVCHFTFDEVVNTLAHTGVPQLHFDQLKVIQHHINSIKYPSEPISSTSTQQCSSHASNPVTIPPTPRKLTRSRLQKCDDWPLWQQAEWQQLDNYQAQGMFDSPTIAPANSAIFHWVWIYSIKPQENNRKKARAVCDGSTRGGQALITGHTYASTPEQTDFRLFLALATIHGLLVYQADVTNAFAEADPPKQRYFMYMDTPFKEWWSQRFPNTSIPRKAVIPILKNLQGHPEASRQWAIHIHHILREYFSFQPLTHAPCLYIGYIQDSLVLFIRQVDDFGLACNNEQTYLSICDQLDQHLAVPITRLGLMQHYNGIDVEQTSHYIKIHSGSYLRKVLASHGWSTLPHKHIPIPSDNAYIKTLDKAAPLEPEQRHSVDRNRFRYRGAIGELIWPMITTRPDISFPVVKLSQFSTAPAMLHYDAIYSIFCYLYHTIDNGIYYTRSSPLAGLPTSTIPARSAAPIDHQHDHHFGLHNLTRLYACSDSDWAMDIRHRRSITGIVFHLAGGAITWKTRVQPTIALSSTEAEFLAASDTGRMTLYLRSLLHDVKMPSPMATPIFVDNRGAYLMANASQPTRQTRHIDIRHFAILEWTERGLIELTKIDGSQNASDLLTKQTGRLLFARHYDNISGLLLLSLTHSSPSHTASKKLDSESEGGCQTQDSSVSRP